MHVLLVATFLYASLYLNAQNKSEADSLEQVYVLGNFDDTDQLNILKGLAVSQTNIAKKLNYSQELLDIAKAMDSVDYILVGYLELGNSYLLKGDLSQSLENYFEFAEIAIAHKMQYDLGIISSAIGGVYSTMGNHKSSIQYYYKAIDILRKIKDTSGLALTLENLGVEYVQSSKPDSALIILRESGELFNMINYDLGKAYNTGNKGLAYAQQGLFSKAENNMDAAVKELNKLGDAYGICDFLAHISQIYIDKNNLKKAEEYALNSLLIAKTNGFKDQISSANLKLSIIYDKAGDQKSSLKFFKNHITYRDSVHNLTSIQQMADMRTNFEVSQKQAEVDILNQQKRTQKVIVFTMIVILGMTGLYYRTISKEKRRSEHLLLNILPTKTAEELKEKGSVDAKKFKAVTVMFTDFQAFTQHSQQLTPEKLVKSVDFYFSKFDEIMEKYQLEKIKTIGDAYMCAGGLTFASKKHASSVIKAAIEIIQFVSESKDITNDQLAHFDIRIGINTGPVVAGVVGSKKFAYDIWGDTVNVASRMESNSMAGKINVSQNTYEIIKEQYDCEFRGEIDVKNKGMMKMYFVLGEKSGIKTKKLKIKNKLKLSR